MRYTKTAKTLILAMGAILSTQTLSSNYLEKATPLMVQKMLEESIQMSQEEWGESKKAYDFCSKQNIESKDFCLHKYNTAQFIKLQGLIIGLMKGAELQGQYIKELENKIK